MMGRNPVRRRAIISLCLYAAIFAAAVAFCPFMGSERLEVGKILAWRSHNTDAEIFFSQRIPRVILGLMVGGALAMAGATFQVILHNPLAEPFTLGVTGGAAVGAVIGSLTGFTIGMLRHRKVLVYEAGRNQPSLGH